MIRSSSLAHNSRFFFWNLHVCSCTDDTTSKRSRKLLHTTNFLVVPVVDGSEDVVPGMLECFWSLWFFVPFPWRPWSLVLHYFPFNAIITERVKLGLNPRKVCNPRWMLGGNNIRLHLRCRVIIVFVNTSSTQRLVSLKIEETSMSQQTWWIKTK